MATAIQALTKRLQAEQRPLTDKEKLVLRLNEQYPRDVGVLSAFFLNYVTLKPGQVEQISWPHAVHCLVQMSRRLRVKMWYI